MAIAVTPETKKSLWANLLFYFSLFLLLAPVLSYLMLEYHFIKRDSEALNDLQEKIVKEGTSGEKALTDRVLKTQTEINDFKILLASHKHFSQFFENIKAIVHPRVWFATVMIDVDEQEASFRGVTESFQELGQQILVFKQFLEEKNIIKKFEVSNILMDKDGKITFDLVISFYSDIFQ